MKHIHPLMIFAFLVFCVCNSENGTKSTDPSNAAKSTPTASADTVLVKCDTSLMAGDTTWFIQGTYSINGKLVSFQRYERAPNPLPARWVVTTVDTTDTTRKIIFDPRCRDTVKVAIDTLGGDG